MAMPIRPGEYRASFMPSPRRPACLLPVSASSLPLQPYLPAAGRCGTGHPAFGHVIRNAANIAREHDGLFFHAYLLQLGYGRPEVGFSTSDITSVAGVLAAWRRYVLWCLSCGSPCNLTPMRFMSLLLPAATSLCRPPLFAMTPLPLISCMSVTRSRSLFPCRRPFAGSC